MAEALFCLHSSCCNKLILFDFFSLFDCFIILFLIFSFVFFYLTAKSDIAFRNGELSTSIYLFPFRSFSLCPPLAYSLSPFLFFLSFSFSFSLSTLSLSLFLPIFLSLSRSIFFPLFLSQFMCGGVRARACWVRYKLSWGMSAE